MSRGDGPVAPVHDFYDHAPCGLLTIAPDGRLLKVNRTFSAWLQYNAEELLEMRFTALLTMGSKVFHQTHWMPLLQMQSSVAEVQFELVRRDGRVIPMLINAAQRVESSGPLAGSSVVDLATIVATDRRKYERELLTARRRAEELLASERQAQQRAAELLRLQEAEARRRATLAEQLIGIVSHDLRNPLNTIVLGANLLGSAPLDEPSAKTVRRIGSAADRATRLIVDLLDLTQARLGGGLSVTCRSVDFHEVIGDCLEEVRFAWPGRTVVHQRLGDGEAEADPDRLAQVVSNLTNNALVYGSGTEAVVVTSEIDASAIRVKVHNQGPPIPEEKRLNLFEPLTRGEQPAGKDFRSVGLGLFIVREIAKSHGGDVTLSSTEADGTTFGVELPRLQTR